MTSHILKSISIVLLVGVIGAVSADDYRKAVRTLDEQLRESLVELDDWREHMANEQLPLSRELADLESTLIEKRAEYQRTSRMLDSRTLDFANLRGEIKAREEEKAYLENLLGEYIRNFEARLHIAEVQRYRATVEDARLAMENGNLSDDAVLQLQCDLVDASLERLQDALGGTCFPGAAVDGAGLVQQGTFLLLGPTAYFATEDAATVGTAESRLGSLEPTVFTFDNPENENALRLLLETRDGILPVDPTLGNARKVEATKETLLEHIAKGGPVMYPILGLAAAAMLVALFKWLTFLFVRRPSRRRMRLLLKAIAEHDRERAASEAAAIRGPTGRMLRTAVDHVKEPRELVEEIMYEKVLETRLKLNRLLPFIAISAASAPLLGLLGTVTGIINTFKLITVFGSGDVKTLSGGISEALITTEFGLIVAIPSLLLHAFLSRKARGVVDQMEKGAIAFMNQLGKTPYKHTYDGCETSDETIAPSPATDEDSVAGGIPAPSAAGA